MLAVSDPDPGDSDGICVQVSYWNSDGRPAEFCGNGARCVAAYLFRSAMDERIRFRFEDVTVDAMESADRVNVSGESFVDRFAILHPRPAMLEPSGPTPGEGHWYNSGVPHWVIPVDRVSHFDLATWGPEVRNHAAFAPRGTNAEVVEIRRDTLHVRTYERGVEGETLACGSGLLAAAWWAHTERGLPWPIHLRSRSGELFIARPEGTSGLWLEGPSRLVFVGTLADFAG